VRRGAWRDGFALAAGTLTVLRVPPPRVVDQAAAGVAMTLAPAAGLLVGLPAAAVAWLARAAGAGEAVAAVLAVGVLSLATGGLHLDGLADTVDGLAAGRGGRQQRDRALEVMRRGDVGPLGAAALVLVLLLQAAALARALPGVGAAAVLVATVAGRTVLPVLCARGVPAARSGGLGAAVAGSVPRGVAAGVIAAAVALAALAGSAGGGLPGAVRWGGAVLAGCAGGALLAGRAARRVGGVTGDVLGAGVEVGTAAVLVVLCLG
jgi:adenosylcobinamide-GDP ribazoletransferase